jgi:hypothetical protein
MHFGRKRQQRTAGREVDYLDLVPRRAVEAVEEPGGRFVLLMPRYRDAVWGRLLQPRLGPGKRYVRVPLEARGAALWAAVDGRRSVRELVEAVRPVTAGDEDDLERRVCLYVQAMVDNGFLALGPSGPAGEAAGSGIP